MIYEFKYYNSYTYLLCLFLVLSRTSTDKEFTEYFANKKIVYFKHEDVTSDNIVDMVFN